MHIFQINRIEMKKPEQSNWDQVKRNNINCIFEQKKKGYQQF